MLITKQKSREDLQSLLPEKVFILLCNGCKEVFFPEQEIEKLISEFLAADKVTGVLTADYICNPENLSLRLKRRRPMIDEAGGVLVFSCGVGVQTVAELLGGKAVYAGCDTIRLPGFQGVTPLEYDCGQCGECYLNLTGGICPITACSKSLVNGQCGGAQNGRCEVDPVMRERIYLRLEAVGRLDAVKCPTQIRNFAIDADKSR